MSTHDNVSIEDASGLPYKLRSKDISAAQDGSLQRSLIFASPYPVDYGTGGCFQLVSKSGVIAAGLAASSPIYSFRWSSTIMNAILRRMRIGAWSQSTGFAAGIATFDLYVARAFTASDSGGVTETVAGNSAKLRTSMATSALADSRHATTAALTAGTRALDAQPLESLNVTVSAAALTKFAGDANGPGRLFERISGEHPMVLAANEGLVLQATVPATGTWSFSLMVEWDEVPIVNY